MHFSQQRPPTFPPAFPPRYPGRGPQPPFMQQPMHQQWNQGGFRQMPMPPQHMMPRPFMHSFRTNDGTLDYNKIFSVLDQTVKVAQQISPLFTVFKRKEKE